MPEKAKPREATKTSARSARISPIIFGPWCFLPQSQSDKAAKALDYRGRGKDYRVPDEARYQYADRNALTPFTFPAGAVLILDSGSCFHYGSRHAINPRYMMIFAYTTPCRTGLTETFLEHQKYPIQESASRLRRMMLAPGPKPINALWRR